MSQDGGKPVETDMTRSAPSNVELPPSYGYRGKVGDHGPCWCCKCVDCCLGGYLHPATAPHFAYRVGDCFGILALWYVGAYQGGTFNRQTMDSFTSLRVVKSDPTGTRRNGIASVDLTVPSSVDPGVNIPIRVFRKIQDEATTMNGKSTPRNLLFFFHGGGW
jgi:hypothetical protein